jgi:hypothetical protein
MTLLVQKPSGAKLLLRQTWAPADTDAAAYIAAVEAADGQALEERTRKAIDDFVLGCKADGIWSAIKASCILAGARTLTGALVPLVGTAPTNVGPFVSGDYNRKTGLLGNGSVKYLNTNRNNNADPQDSRHISAYISTVSASTASYPGYIGYDVTNSTQGGSFHVGRLINNSADLYARGCMAVGFNTAAGVATLTGLVGVRRGSSASYAVRAGLTSFSFNQSSITPLSGNIEVFRVGTVGSFAAARLAFYSIGESLDLTLLDARVSQLITTFAAVIP